jgi:hypothetical protein
MPQIVLNLGLCINTFQKALLNSPRIEQDYNIGSHVHASITAP